MNANVAGCYSDPGIYHSPDPSMAPTPIALGAAHSVAAKAWASLDPALLARTVFFHHGTYTNAHGDHSKVNRLMGAVKRQEMLISLLAKNLAPCFGSVQTEPTVLSDNLITFAGATLPVLSPPNLQAVLASPTGPLYTMQKRRDADLDRLNALYKRNGTTAQRALLDKYALSQTQVRSLSQQLLGDLARIKGTSRTDLNIAAAVLFRMNVTPVVVMQYGFGGDNHTDAGLATEAAETSASVAAIGDLVTRLKSYGLDDTVTIALQNVFGRSLSTKSHENNPDGRNHNALHHASVFIGKGFRGAVVGGVTPTQDGSDYRAQGLDSTTGAPTDSGDVPFDDTLAAAGKTLGAALGVDPAVLDDQITQGKIVTAALAKP
jgi:hypothetical protein